MYAKFYQYGGPITAGLCIALCAGYSAYGQEQTGPQTANHNKLTSLFTCQNVTPDAAKIECYDRISHDLQVATQDGEILILNASALRDIQVGVFGFNSAPFAKPGQEYAAHLAPLETITIPVRKIERYLSGYVITLDNNQVWEQFAGNLSRLPKGKLTAEIKKTPTGTYKMALFNTKTRIPNIRVRRIQ